MKLNMHSRVQLVSEKIRMEILHEIITSFHEKKRGIKKFKKKKKNKEQKTIVIFT